MTATVTSHLVNDALSISKAALRTVHGTNGVFRLQGDTLAWTPVKTGASDVNNVEILSGLQPGDRVADRVVEPSDAEIKNGLRVKAAKD